MKWQRIPLGILQTNCYLLSNENKECIVIDPGEEGEKLQSIINAQKLKPIAILLTHAHFDHIGAVDMIRDTYHIPVYVHKKEAAWLSDPALNGSERFMMGKAVRQEPADHLIDQELKLSIGSFSFDVFETPGHSPGSISFYVKELNVVFSGDALFQNSVGRTDLPGGNHQQLISSIKNKLFALPDVTMVLSGHGPETIIDHEKRNNPFL
ncbi:MBL fold metallo-hydrolase [Heyndrickxia sporothermodurans]|uniref:MBL fold metallo-hydrolase n=1 Tax=Heyndrickxia sporothermodurans TaxID=46224 RepID=A0AB37HF53_9BACI|nr:MBL fold metallo-hydrolase [Heyndrickxia sporothermodurans]MBL5766053.1 MBL fold metallo-hydrolase [Heyndrickxia sporothermodurans]MBL5773275.1 MBL fold metallo-hydrolase [Heyndrickxia sporothermodurans]MBL5777095.1 MBL fold metallo-hydrolase [Heyndrickxia sporothermodurans]MBL5780504.1 MBL fold metallo-hydrolase [Heyndrickxia sporothermodurans]MBL5783863.1 MBL fold metallo-hydrolase [Heyndrickxia sporothermodurans]